MIQKEGIIKSPTEKEQIAIEHLLFDKGFINANRRVTTSGPDFSWCGDKSFGNVDGMFGSSVSGFAGLKEHTLSDFNLLPGGEPMLTFGNLKAGDPNPFVVGQDVKVDGSNGTVTAIKPGPAIGVDHGRSFEWYGWQLDGLLRSTGDINTVFPVVRPTTQEQPAPHEYQFGDKVKVEGFSSAQAFICETGNGFCLLASFLDFQKTKAVSPANFPVETCSLSSVSPWPEPVTLWFCTSEDREEKDRVTISKGGVSLGRKGYSIEDAIAIGQAAAKIRGNE